uniref:Protein Ycf2 n=1 Tax=Eustrephus latifolius TaxID=101708 RepID=A0A0U1XDG7_EUSLA|nr:hypothetical protein ycf2 [Eustrephus latifolius]YP_009092743.1 hypothetical protein ycf2 [Eustrephus latifolius]AIR12577.1 hypothetical protein ycf2 [Eustrephus latifolius]AIR12580.1 hypothetical protein ycf2 [Eustrephus latifolius]
MKRQFQLWIFELQEVLREIKNSNYLVDLWVKSNSVGAFIYVFFHQERFMKLFDPRIFGILFSHDSRGSTSRASNRYLRFIFMINGYFMFMINGGVLIVVTVFIFRITNRKMFERKNLYLRGLFPIPLNSIGPRNETLEESSNINKLIVSLLQKGKKISESCFMDPQESTWVLPPQKKFLMPESNRGSRWWRNRIGKKRDSSCKIANETVAGIEISFKEKDSKYLEFLFLSYTDDPIRKDHDWELLDRLSPRKKRNIINLNSGQLLEILGKDLICYLMSAFREKRPEGFFKQQGAGATIQYCAQFHMWQFRQDLFVSWEKNQHESDFLRNVSRENWIWLDMVNKDRFFSRVRNVLSNIQYDSTRSIFVQVTDSSQSNGSSDQSRDHFDSIRNEDSEYHTLIDQIEIQQLKERSILWDLQTERTEIESDRFTKGEKQMNNHNHLLPKEKEIEEILEKQMNNHLLPKEIEEFLGNSTRSIRSFFSDSWSELYLGSNPTEGSTRDQKFLKKKQDLSFVPCRGSENKEMVHIFKIIPYLQNTVSIHPISMDSSNKISFLNKNLFLGLFHLFHDRNKGGYTLHHDFESEGRFQEMADLFTLSITEPDLVYHRGFAFSDESKKKSLLVLPRLKRAVFASNKAVNQSRLIRNLIQIQYRTYGYIRNVSNQFFLMNRSDRNFEYGIQRDQIGNDTLNHITIMKYTINQHLSNLKKSQKKWFDPLISRTERSRNRDPGAYRYKWSNGSKNFQEHLEHFLSEQKSLFQVVFDRLRINQYLIDWSEAVDKQDLSKSLLFKFRFLFKSLRFLSKSLPFFLSKSLPFFLSKALPFFFVSIGNTPIHRSEIRVYEWKGPNDQPCNQLLESIGVQIVRLNKLKPLLLDDHDTSQRPKFLSNGGTFLFKKIQKWMIDSFRTRNNRGKSFDNTDSYFSTISHDRDNWLNPVKPFHRSSLISSFYKANRLRFLNDPHHFWFYCNKRFPFSVEKIRIHNDDLTYGQFLNILFIRNKIFSLCVGQKKHRFLERETISPIESQVSDIFIPNDFLQSGDETYNLYKSFHFPIGPFVRRAIYSIADISATPLREEQIVNFERTYCQPLSDMNLSDSEGKNLHQYLSFNSNMGLIHTPCSAEKCLPRKKRSLCLSRKKYVRTFRQALDFSLLKRRWKLFKTYMPWVFTLTGFKYLKSILLQIVLDPVLIQGIRLKFVSIFRAIRRRCRFRFKKISWLIPRRISRGWTKIRALISKMRSKIQNLNKWFKGWILKEESIYRKNGKPVPLTWTHLRSRNAREFIYSILFLLLVAGYLVTIHLIVASGACSQLQAELEKIKALMMDSYMIELEKLLDWYPVNRNTDREYRYRYPLSGPEPDPEPEPELDYTLSEEEIPLALLIYYIRVFLESLIKRLLDIILAIQLEMYSLDCDLIGLIFIKLKDLIKSPIDDFVFTINTRYLSRTSKELYSLIRERRIVNGDWIDDKIESWVAISSLVLPEEREFVARFSNLTKEKRIDKILLSLTHSDPLSKDRDGYQMSEHPGCIYLRNLVDMQNKDLMNYEFNRSCLAERRIFLAHYQTITCSQRANRFHFPSHGLRVPFSLRAARLPSKGILVIGSTGTGRSWFVKYLVRNSYVPFITVFPTKFRNEKFLDFEDDPFSFDVSPFSFGGDDFEAELGIFLKDLVRNPDEYTPKKEKFNIILQFELAKAMSPCIIWIPKIHDLYLKELHYLSLGLLENYLSKDCERRNTLVIASTNIPQKVDPIIIAPEKLNTFIKVRRTTIPQQREHLFILSHTRGFHLEKKIFDTQANGLGSIIIGSTAQDLVALINGALSISISQSKSIIGPETVRLALYRQTWNFRDRIRPIRDDGVIAYQIGRAFAQTVFLNECLVDPISIYMRKELCISDDRASYLFKWYYELGTSMKKLTILLYLLSCSAGSVAEDVWSSPPGSGTASSRFLSDDSDLVHGLLDLLDTEGAVAAWTEKDCSPFDNNRLLRSKPRNPFDIMPNVSFSEEAEFEVSVKESPFMGVRAKDIGDELLNQIAWAPKLWRPWAYLFGSGPAHWGISDLDMPSPGKGVISHKEDQLDEQLKELIKEIEYELQEEELKLKEKEGRFEKNEDMYEEVENEDEGEESEDELEEGEGMYEEGEDMYEEVESEEEGEESEDEESEDEDEEMEDKFKKETGVFSLEHGEQVTCFTEEGFFQISQFIWDPADPVTFLAKDLLSNPVFGRIEVFADEETAWRMAESTLYESADDFEDLEMARFLNFMDEESYLWGRNRKKWFKYHNHNFAPNRCVRFNTLFESYQYLSNIFRSNRTQFDQMTKTLWRKRFLLPNELKDLIMEIFKQNTMSG